MDLFSLLGRTLIASLFIVSALMTIFTKGGFQNFSDMFKSKNLPLPNVLAALSLMLKIVGGLLIIFDYSNFNKIILSILYSK